MNRTFAALALLVGALVSTSASAQVPLERFSAVRLQPAPGAGNFLQVEGVHGVSGDIVPGGGLAIDYAHRPFELQSFLCNDDPTEDCPTGANLGLVEYTLQFNLYGSLVLFDRVQVGLNVPLVLGSGDGFDRAFTNADGTVQPVSVTGGTRFAVGDPQLSVKGRIWNNDVFFLGATVYASFPVAHQMEPESFLGDESLRLGGHVIAEILTSGLQVAVNVGGFYRPERVFLSTEAKSQLVYRLGVGYAITPLVKLFVELDGASTFGTHLADHPLEARLGGSYRIGDFEVGAAIGKGITEAVGTPFLRGAVNLRYAPLHLDADGDSINDDVDACPDEPEDMDQWEDADGCPDPDNDADGVDDASDACSDEPEDADGFEDDDGCPDDDNDQDGVRDGFDTCPNDPEDMDGDRDQDGCPDNDTDRDGIEDDVDACPDEPEDTDGFGDEDGCPEEDFDEDGIPDDGDECADQPEIFNNIRDEDGCPEADDDSDGVVNEVDRCPNIPETYNGSADNDGCADGPSWYEVDESEVLRAEQPIRFRSNQPTLRSHGASLTHVLALVLNRYPSLHATIRVVAEPRELVDQRLDVLRETLLEAGVHPVRLSFEGTVGPNENIAEVTASVPDALRQAPPPPPPAPAEAAPEPEAESAPAE